MMFGLPDDTLAHIRAVLARHPQVREAILYGSRARASHSPGSDIDLTLVGGDDLTLDVLSAIMHELDDLLLPYSFDLSIFHKISDPNVRAHIQRTGKLFYHQQSDPKIVNRKL